MEYDTKIGLVAKILIEKHGRRAPDVARKRAKERLDNRDFSAALVWVQVTEATTRLIAEINDGGDTVSK